MTDDRVGDFRPLEVSTPKVDFYTATTPWPIAKELPGQAHIRAFYDLIPNMFGGAFLLGWNDDDWTIGRGDERYWYTAKHVPTGIRVQFGGRTKTARLDMSGVPCANARAVTIASGETLFEGLFRDPMSKPTRVDIATDFSEPITPWWIIENRGKSNVKGSSYIEDVGGWTYYVGSWKSDRYAAVYLYDWPHPRCNNTRIEIRNFDAYAIKARSRLLTGDSIDRITAEMATTFGFEILSALLRHPDAPRFTASRDKNPDANRLQWLYGQVAPAMAEMLATNQWDMTEFIAHVVALSRGEK